MIKKTGELAKKRDFPRHRCTTTEELGRIYLQLFIFKNIFSPALHQVPLHFLGSQTISNRKSGKIDHSNVNSLN